MAYAGSNANVSTLAALSSVQFEMQRIREALHAFTTQQHRDGLNLPSSPTQQVHSESGGRGPLHTSPGGRYIEAILDDVASAAAGKDDGPGLASSILDDATRSYDSWRANFSAALAEERLASLVDQKVQVCAYRRGWSVVCCLC